MINRALFGVDRLLTQTAVIQRDMATGDQFGARGARDWQDLAPVACFMWWGTGATITRIGGVQVKPEQTVDLDVGGLALPEGTDVTPLDRIRQVTDQDGTVTVGPFEILAVAPFEGVTEISFRRIS